MSCDGTVQIICAKETRIQSMAQCKVQKRCFEIDFLTNFVYFWNSIRHFALINAYTRLNHTMNLEQTCVNLFFKGRAALCFQNIYFVDPAPPALENVDVLHDFWFFSNPIRHWLSRNSCIRVNKLEKSEISEFPRLSREILAETDGNFRVFEVTRLSRDKLGN